LTMLDSYGDGWNGADWTLKTLDSATTIAGPFTFTSGSSGSSSFTVSGDGGGSGDTCKGAGKFMDVMSKCAGQAKDACPAGDCEWKADDEKCDLGVKFMGIVASDEDVKKFYGKFAQAAGICDASSTTESACSAAKCGWETDFDKEGTPKVCNPSAASITDGIGCGSLKGRAMAIMAKESRAKAAKMQTKAKAATAKVAAAKAKLAKLPATATAEEKAAIANEVTAAEAEETKFVAAAAASEKEAAAVEKDAAENSTARALASCAAAVLASLLAGLMAF